MSGRYQNTDEYNITHVSTVWVQIDFVRDFLPDSEVMNLILCDLYWNDAGVTDGLTPFYFIFSKRECYKIRIFYRCGLSYLQII